MGYFTYTKSEEELKEQYRKLLIKYNYKDERNKKIIEAISQEYQQMLKQVKYDNGYRTFGQKIKEKAEAGYNDYKRNQEMEANRKDALRTRIWTKEDLQKILNEMKAIMRRTIPAELRCDNEYIIKQIKMSIYGAKRKKEIYDACTKYIAYVRSEDGERFNRLKEMLEYCVFYLAGKDESKEETILRQLEDQLGQYAQDICNEYLDDDVDPIEDLKIRREAQIWAGNEEAQEKDLKVISNALAVFFSLPGIAVILIWLAFVYDMLQTNIAALTEIGSYVPLFIGLGWLWFIHLIKKTNQKRIERRNRIIGKEKNKEIHNQVSILRFIMRLFGF